MESKILQQKDNIAPPVAKRALRVGVAGLGVAASQILPSFKAGSPFELVAGADTQLEAREAFSADYDCPALGSVEELCARPDIDVIWI